MKAVQYFSDEYLERCKDMTPEEILQFLEDYQNLHHQAQAKSKSKLISMKVPEPLLNTFRHQCELEGVKYQTKIKELMKDYLIKVGSE